jgi:hypothetical protein
MPRMQHPSDKVLDYFRTADLGQAELVLHQARRVVKERQPKKATTPRKARTKPGVGVHDNTAYVTPPTV